MENLSSIVIFSKVVAGLAVDKVVGVQEGCEESGGVLKNGRLRLENEWGGAKLVAM